MKNYVLSADIGKFSTKVMGRDLEGAKEDIKTVNFKTKIYNLENGNIDTEGNSYKVEHENIACIIGEQGSNKSNDTSKINDLHRLCCYTAITQFIEPGTKDNNIYMVLACPLSILLVEDLKEEFKSFIKGNGKINIKVNDLEYEFEIKEIMIKAEGSGIIYLAPEIFKNKAVGIVDLGGLNMGFSLYIDKVCKKQDRFIEECGHDRLMEIVREKLSNYKKGDLIKYDIAEKALLEGYLKQAGKAEKETETYINAAKEQYFNEVMENIKNHKFDINELDTIVFVGGTSSHIKEIIKDNLYHNYIAEESNLTNVKGNYKIAIAKYGGVK